MKYYITKYAVTDGIFVRDCEPPKDGREYIFPGGYDVFRVGKNAFTSQSDAIEVANKDRDKKIASLKKQIAKLEKMVFTVPDEADGDSA